MKLESKYKSILDNGFRNHFPRWDDMSPLDPMKLFVEGISSSLGAIEKRQQRMIDTVMDSLPSLFGFTPKRARFAEALFSFQLGSKQKRRTVPANTLFQFSNGENTIEVAPIADLELMPVSDLSEERQGKTLKLKFKVREAVPYLPFAFIPATGATPNAITQMKCEIKEADGGKTLQWKDFSVTDETSGFSHFGKIEFAPRAGELNADAAEFTLTVEFERELQGSLNMNVFPCSILRFIERLELGELKGEAWEEIALSENIPGAPAEITLSYPDSRTLILGRMESDILRLKQVFPQRFENSFFYNAVNHTLVFPAAHKLVENFNGEVRITAARVPALTELDLIPSSYQSVLGEHTAYLETIRQIAPLSASLKRETKTMFLTRFYRTLDGINQPGATKKDVSTQQIITEVIGADESIRVADCKMIGKQVQIFLMTKDPADRIETKVEDAVASKVAKKLGETLPLDYQWSIMPYSKRPFEVRFEIDVELSTDRVGSITQEMINNRVIKATTHALQIQPFGLFKNELTREQLMEFVKAELVAKQEDHSQLLPEEILNLRCLVLDKVKGTYQNIIHREPGEILTSKVIAETQIRSLSRQQTGMRFSGVGYGK